ncbi:MAG: FadR/GntR family transcriptional regulator [Actinomycetota bacterium]
MAGSREPATLLGPISGSGEPGDSFKRRSLVEEVVEAFRRDFLTGRLRRGQRLPTEFDLVQRLGVSRGAVREAMKTLEAIGVVDINRGDGMRVADGESPSLLNPLVFSLLLQDRRPAQLVELRSMIEVGYCQLAAQSATPDDWARIEEAERQYEDYANVVDRDVDRHTQLDLEFHFAVLDATHNPLVIRIGRVVEELYHNSIRGTLQDAAGFEFGVSAHRRTIDALRRGDPEEIRRTVIESLTYWAREVDRADSEVDE